MSFKLKAKRLIIFLSTVALLVSIYLYYYDISKKGLVCIIDSGCDLVLKSEYSRIFGVPLSLIGIIYFSVILILVNFPKLVDVFHIISFFGFLFGMYLIFLQIFVIKNFCQYCFLVDVLAIVIFALSYQLKAKNL